MQFAGVPQFAPGHILQSPSTDGRCPRPPPPTLSSPPSSSTASASTTFPSRFSPSCASRGGRSRTRDCTRSASAPLRPCLGTSRGPTPRPRSGIRRSRFPPSVSRAPPPRGRRTWRRPRPPCRRPSTPEHRRRVIVAAGWRSVVFDVPGGIIVPFRSDGIRTNIPVIPRQYFPFVLL